MEKPSRTKEALRKASFVTVLALGATGLSACGAESGKTTPDAYVCHDLERWTVQDGQNIDNLIDASGALEVASDYGQDEQLKKRIINEAYTTRKDLADSFEAPVLGSIPSVDVPVFPGEIIELPTNCEPKDS